MKTPNFLQYYSLETLIDGIRNNAPNVTSHLKT